MKIKILLFLLVLFGLSIIFVVSKKTDEISQIAGVTSESATPAVTFPKDHKAHPDFLAEWWYLNLLVKTEQPQSKNLSYVISFSRVANTNTLLTSRYEQDTNKFKENLYKLGTLKMDLVNKQTLKVEYSSTAAALSLVENTKDSSKRVSYSLVGFSPTIGKFDLLLKERTVNKFGKNTPLLWGCTGKISVFSKLDTYYYSIPDLDITGTITDIDGTKHTISMGKAWIDHQWFNSKPTSDWLGHYWSGTHVTTKDDFFSKDPHEAYGLVTQIYKDGPKYSYWVKRNVDGTNSCGENVEYKIDSYFTSGYPKTFTIKAPAAGLKEYKGSISSGNQIFKSSGVPFTEPVNYANGKKSDGADFIGIGFLETSLKK